MNVRSGDRTPSERRRGRGSRGSALAGALVLLFAFTAGGVIWLSRDVNRVVTNRSAAQSIAFQSARAGAQQVEVGSLRDGTSTVVLDESQARLEAFRTARQMFEEYGVTGTSSITVAGDTVTATVTIEDPTGDVTVEGSAQAQTGP